MPFEYVKQVVIDHSLRNLCFRPYPNHPKGCPNYNKRKTCPPSAPFFEEIINMVKPIYVVWNVFAFGDHVLKMKEKHPTWSQRQLENCLYWQPTARKALVEECRKFPIISPRHLFLMVPEAYGVNVTATMESIGQYLEWPPKTMAYQVAIAGTPIRG